MALKEFDFLHSHDDTIEESLSQEYYPAPPAQFANDHIVGVDDEYHRAAIATAAGRPYNNSNLNNNNGTNIINAQRPPQQHQKSFAPDLLRPVLTMPPVVLMGGGTPVTPSPIVEEPPSPAPSQLPMIEYPEEEYYAETVDDDYLDINIEVRLVSTPNHFGLMICCGSASSNI